MTASNGPQPGQFMMTNLAPDIINDRTMWEGILARFAAKQGVQLTGPVSGDVIEGLHGVQVGRLWADAEPFPPPGGATSVPPERAPAPAPAVRVITPEPRSRLDALLEQRDLAKAEAEKARDALAAIEDGIKYELARQLREGENKVEVASPHLARPLRLTYVESWRVDATKLKDEAPEIYVRYAKKSNSWKLAPVGSKAGGA